MSLNELRDKAYKIAQEHGFHKRSCSLPERLMLVVTELSEATEADRNDKWENRLLSGWRPYENNPEAAIKNDDYETHVKGTVEEEIAEAIIRLLDIAGVYNIDLDWHIQAKMAYNENRELSKHMNEKYERDFAEPEADIKKLLPDKNMPEAAQKIFDKIFNTPLESLVLTAAEVEILKKEVISERF